MKERANIPVEKKTRDALKRVKLKEQARLKKDVTWDDFLLKRCKK